MPNIKGKIGKRVSGVEKRRAVRYSAMAGVCIHGFEGEALLSNISSGGFRMESKTYISLVPGESYTIKITPEPAANLGFFELSVTVRWVRSTVSSFEAGFSIAEPATDRSFKRYIDYLSGSLPDNMFT
jgi:hypothetical protein